MNTKIGRVGLAIGALAAVMVAGAPAFAEGHGGGGHGGGGHASGAHGSAGGHGANVASHGYAGGRGGGGYGYGGGRGLAGVQHFAPGGRAGYGGGYGGYVHTHAAGAYWGGGYWRGGYWPRAWYGLGFSWFLPILPLAYATYWWDGMPYYYANDVYYTWNPSYDGYVATDPPPVTDGEGAVTGGGGPASEPGPAPAPAAGGQIFMYPKNGQSDAQLSTDRLECQQWASSQTGGGGRADEYRRAMTACAEARGYSAR